MLFNESSNLFPEERDAVFSHDDATAIEAALLRQTVIDHDREVSKAQLITVCRTHSDTMRRGRRGTGGQ